MRPVTARGLLHEVALHETATGGTRSSVHVLPVVPVPQPAAPPRRRGILRGFAARRDVRIAIDGAGYHVDFSVRTDDYGLYAGTFGSTAAAGRYEIVAIDGALNARVSIDTVAGSALAARATAFCGTELTRVSVRSPLNF